MKKIIALCLCSLMLTVTLSSCERNDGRVSGTSTQSGSGLIEQTDEITEIEIETVTDPTETGTETETETDQEEDCFVSSPQNDTDPGLKIIKINSDDSELSEDQKAIVEYFDEDYLTVFNYDALRRYPQLFDDSQVNVCGCVVKVLSMDSDNYQLVIWMDVAFDTDSIPEKWANNYLLISGTVGEESFKEEDILTVYGQFVGLSTVEVDGKSYTIPTINAQEALTFLGDFRNGFINSVSPIKYDNTFVKRIAKIVFGEDIEIRKPIIGTDIPEEAERDYFLHGVDFENHYLIVELEDQSNVHFSRFAISKGTGLIKDIKDGWGFQDFRTEPERYLEFAPDFNHYFIFTYNKELENLTLEYYDKDFNKIWKREFEETTNAKYDYTKNNIYLSVNNELYIINTETGEDTFPQTYVGDKMAIRKLEDGILMIATNKSDGVMMANLDGSIKWKTNLESNVFYVSGLQVLGDRIVFNYRDDSYTDTYVAIDQNTGEIITSVTP